MSSIKPKPSLFKSKQPKNIFAKRITWYKFQITNNYSSYLYQEAFGHVYYNLTHELL